MNENTPPPPAAAARQMLASALSIRARLGYTLLLLASLGGAGVTGALLATEPALPGRTRLALAVLVAIGLAWTAFAAWVLARRRVLLATHRVVAARMAVAFSAVFTAGAWIAGQWGGAGRFWYAAAGVGVAMLLAAAVLLLAAKRRVDDLTRRRVALERQLGMGKGGAR